MNSRSNVKMCLTTAILCLAVAGLAWATPAEARTGATVAGTSASLLTPPPGTTGSRGGTSEGGTPKSSPVQTDLGEAFDDITVMPGWFFQNNSSPLGTTAWFQGNATVFPAHTGATTSYIGANFNNTAGVGTISNWMLTPELPMKDGDTVSFWTRVPTGGGAFPDRLQIRLSLAGASTNVGTLATNVGDFTTLLLDINPTYSSTGYPEVWTQYSATLSGIPPASTGRIGFRYFVTNGGPSGSNSNYIGIDTFEFVEALLPANVFGTKTVTGSFVPGGTITYTIVLSNTGAGAQADNAGDELSDTLPASLTATGATASSGTVAQVGNLVTWNGSIPAGGSVTITITATVNAVAFGTTISSQGTVNYDATGGGTNGASRLTDDPAVAGASNPTVFLVADPSAIPGLQLPGLVALILLTGLAAAFALRRIA